MSGGDGSDDAAHRRLIAYAIPSLIIILGAAIAAGLTWQDTSPDEPRIAAQQNANAPEADYQPGGAGCDPRGLRRLPSQQAQAKRDRCAGAREEHRVQQQQIAQAIRANDIAYWNLRLLYKQARAGAVQAVATVLAFIAAAVAAVFAGMAAHHTKRSADADNEALEEARKASIEQAKTGGRQLELLGLQTDLIEKQKEISRLSYLAEHRPKLKVREVRISNTGLGMNIRYTIANVGEGRCTIVQSQVRTEDVDDGLIRPLPPHDGRNPIGEVTIREGSHVEMIHDSVTEAFGLMRAVFDVNGRKWDDQRPVPMVLFRGFIEYVDDAGIYRRTAFCRSYEWATGRLRPVDDADYEYAD